MANQACLFSNGRKNTTACFIPLKVALYMKTVRCFAGATLSTVFRLHSRVLNEILYVLFPAVHALCRGSPKKKKNNSISWIVNGIWPDLRNMKKLQKYGIKKVAEASKSFFFLFQILYGEPVIMLWHFV